MSKLFAIVVGSVAAKTDIEASVASALSGRYSFPAATIEGAAKAVLEMALDAEGMNRQDVLCTRDYGATCPDEWIDAGNGGDCQPPVC